VELSAARDRVRDSVPLRIALRSTSVPLDWWAAASPPMSSWHPAGR